MYITEFSADGFKNLTDVSMNPSSGVNVIIGENAQGKTNLIEAIWMLSGARSFRGTKEKDTVGFDRDFARLRLVLSTAERENTLEAVLSRNTREKRILLNGIKQRYLSGLFGTLKCVIFTPEDLDLTKGAPDNRRSFIDLCISQIKPAYSRTSSKYENVLLQRNTLLKNIAQGISSPSDLDVWDEQMARLGAYISVIRYQYVKKLRIFAKKLYGEISGGKEELGLKYVSTVYQSLEGRADWSGELSEAYLDMLRKNRGEDIRVGFTLSGVHRDDAAVEVNGISVKDFGSQGQNRSAALSMKLAQAYILCEETSEMPVILLDDVLSELDRSRRDFIITKLSGMQIFITACEHIPKLRGKKFTVSGGRVSAPGRKKKERPAEKP